MPFHFYHATVQYEAATGEDMHAMLAALTKEIQTTFAVLHRDNAIRDGKWIIELSSIWLNFPRLDGDILSIEMQVSCHDNIKMNYELPTYDVVIRLSPGIDKRFRDKQTIGESLPLSIVFTRAGTSENECRPLSRKLEEPRVFMVSSSTADAVRTYVNSMRGFPAHASGGFVRMLYFSAIVISTLGFGDILPLTTAARALVAAEAILGIVLIGLFLNSLFAEREDKG